MVIREVKREELAACARLIRESFLTVAEAFGFTPGNAPGFTAFAATEEGLLRHFADEKHRMYACEAQGAIVGYYSLRFEDPDRCQLNHLCVSPAARHQGIGESLLRHAFRLAEDFGCSRMEIGIVEENQVLRKWYEGFGFVHLGAHKPDHLPFTCGRMEKTLP